MATAQDYMQAVLDDIRAAPPGLVPRKALYDVRESELHSREIADALAEFHQRVTPDMEKVAVVTNAALEGLQGKRISPPHISRAFYALEDARDWLAEG